MRLGQLDRSASETTSLGFSARLADGVSYAVANSGLGLFYTGYVSPVQEIVGYARGFSGTNVWSGTGTLADPLKFPNTARYIVPAMVVNATGTGRTVVDYVIVEDATADERILSINGQKADSAGNLAISFGGLARTAATTNMTLLPNVPYYVDSTLSISLTIPATVTPGDVFSVMVPNGIAAIEPMIIVGAGRRIALDGMATGDNLVMQRGDLVNLLVRNSTTFDFLS